MSPLPFLFAAGAATGQPHLMRRDAPNTVTVSVVFLGVLAGIIVLGIIVRSANSRPRTGGPAATAPTPGSALSRWPSAPPTTARYTGPPLPPDHPPLARMHPPRFDDPQDFPDSQGFTGDGLPVYSKTLAAGEVRLDEHQ